jgi:hypothetical protein
MTEVWISQQSFHDAVKAGGIKVMGDPMLANRLQEWLRSSLLSWLGILEESPKLEWNFA